MADKTIGELPIASALYDDSLLVVEQQSEARSIRGALLAKFAKESAEADVQRAVQSAESAAEAAKKAADALSQTGAIVNRAETAATTATGAANRAEAAEERTEQASTDVQKYVQRAETAADAAESSQTAAAKSAQDAANAAEKAAQGAVDTAELLQGYVDEANSAKDAAKESQTAAESAKDEAVTAGAAATQSAEQASASAETAKQYSGNPPQIGEDGTWETWDAASGAYTDTNKPSRGIQGEQGEPGVSPTVSTNKVGKTTTVTITDAEGEHQFEVRDGADGTGSGDMTKEVYDPNGREQDIFQYVDEAVANVEITTDDEVTEESQNPVKSSGIYKALQNVKIEVDPVPTSGSEKAVQSGGVYDALSSKANLGEDGKVVPEELPEHLIVGEDSELGTVLPVDADTLEGHPADYFVSDTKLAAGLEKKQDVLPYYTNKNIFDNWYFVGGGSQKGGSFFPVNQRGETVYSSAGPTIDRWEGNQNTTYPTELTDAGINVKSNRNMIQRFDHLPGAGETVTVSVLLADNTLATVTGKFPTKTGYTDYLDGNRGFRFESNLSAKVWSLHLWNNDLQSSDVLVAAKLELGPQQTLAHKEGDTWVLNEVPDYATELAKCQRYQLAINSLKNYGRYGTGFAIRENAAYIFVPTPVTMRATPTLAKEGAFRLWDGVANIAVTNVRFDAASTNGVSIACDVESGLTVYRPYELNDAGTGDSKIILDANL